jgi:hypothetical protein
VASLALLVLLACGDKKEPAASAASKPDGAANVVDSGQTRLGPDGSSVDGDQDNDGALFDGSQVDVSASQTDVSSDAPTQASFDVAVSPDTTVLSPSDAVADTGVGVDVVKTEPQDAANPPADTESQPPVDAAVADAGGAVDMFDSAPTPALDVQSSLDTAPSGAVLQWYKSCGMPVCKGWSAKPGIAMCAGQNPGQPCSSKADKCDPKDFCDAVLICTDVDPTKVGCGKSSRRFKREIRYLDVARRKEMATWLRTQRLATWMYADGDGRSRLGFVIEDQPGSPAIDARGDRVDLYSYASMLAAALQSQAVRIEQLERRVEAARSQDSGVRQRPR